eukprot:Em0003g161a
MKVTMRNYPPPEGNIHITTLDLGELVLVARYDVSREKACTASLPQAPYDSATRGIHVHPNSEHLASLAECFLSSAATAADPAVRPASEIKVGLSGDTTVRSKAAAETPHGRNCFCSTIGVVQLTAAMSESNPKCSCCQTTQRAVSGTNVTHCVQCINLHAKPPRIRSANTSTKCDCCQLTFAEDRDPSVRPAEYQCGEDKYYLCDPCHSQHPTCPVHPASLEKLATSSLRSPKKPSDIADAAPRKPQHTAVKTTERVQQRPTRAAKRCCVIA